MFIGHQDTNMAKVILARMNEWHQVQRKYALEIDVQYIFDLHEESKTLEECQVIFDQLESGEITMQMDFFDIKRMTIDIFDQLERKAEKKNCTLKLKSQNTRLDKARNQLTKISTRFTAASEE